MPKLDDLLGEIEFGKVVVVVQNGKIVSVPEQRIEWPCKTDGIVKTVEIKKVIEIDQ